MRGWSVQSESHRLNTFFIRQAAAKLDWKDLRGRVWRLVRRTTRPPTSVRTPRGRVGSGPTDVCATKGGFRTFWHNLAFRLRRAGPGCHRAVPKPSGL